jgi:hypothetical protein
MRGRSGLTRAAVAPGHEGQVLVARLPRPPVDPVPGEPPAVDVSGGAKREEKPAQAPDSPDGAGESQGDAEHQSHFGQPSGGRPVLLEVTEDDITYSEDAHDNGRLQPERIRSPHRYLSYR